MVFNRLGFSGVVCSFCSNWIVVDGLGLVVVVFKSWVIFVLILRWWLISFLLLSMFSLFSWLSLIVNFGDIRVLVGCVIIGILNW